MALAWTGSACACGTRASNRDDSRPVPQWRIPREEPTVACRRIAVEGQVHPSNDRSKQDRAHHDLRCRLWSGRGAAAGARGTAGTMPLLGVRHLAAGLCAVARSVERTAAVQAGGYQTREGCALRSPPAHGRPGAPGGLFQLSARPPAEGRVQDPPHSTRYLGAKRLAREARQLPSGVWASSLLHQGGSARDVARRRLRGHRLRVYVAGELSPLRVEREQAEPLDTGAAGRRLRRASHHEPAQSGSLCDSRGLGGSSRGAMETPGPGTMMGRRINSVQRRSTGHHGRSPAQFLRSRSATMRCDALVLDASLRQALVTVRSLGRRGLAIAAAETHPEAPAFASRWCQGGFVLPAQEGTDAYAALLEQWLDGTGARVLIASNDATIALLRRHRARLEQRLHLALAPERALATAINKQRTLEVARRLEVPVPREVAVRDGGDVAAALKEIGLPAVIKPSE